MKKIINTTAIITITIVGLLFNSQSSQAGPIQTNILGAICAPPATSPPYNIVHPTNAPNTSIWLTPPAGSTMCALTNYNNTTGQTWHYLAVRRSDGTLYGPGTNALTFPVSTTTSYEIEMESWKSPGVPVGTTVYCKSVWGN
jgi:hypothetical protein